MAHLVACPSFSPDFLRPLLDRLWGLGHQSELVAYRLDASQGYLASCEASIQARLNVSLRRPVLLGYSFGGYFAARIAAMRPDSISALVLVAAPPGLAEALSRIANDMDISPTEAARRLAPGLDAVRLLNELRRVPVAQEAGSLASRIDVPVLAVCGSQDRIAPSEGETLHARILHAELAVVEDGHFFRSSQASVAERIHEFLSRNAVAIG